MKIGNENQLIDLRIRNNNNEVLSDDKEITKMQNTVKKIALQISQLKHSITFNQMCTLLVRMMCLDKGNLWLPFSCIQD